MSNVFERFSKVAKSEWNALRRRRPGEGGADDESRAADDGVDDALRGAVPARPAARAVPDVDAALRILELPRGVTLDAVRARYRELARRYQPKTQSPRLDEAQAAHTLMLALTDALELLEEHLLPLP